MNGPLAGVRTLTAAGRRLPLSALISRPLITTVARLDFSPDGRRSPILRDRRLTQRRDDGNEMTPLAGRRGSEAFVVVCVLAACAGAGAGAGADAARTSP